MTRLERNIYEEIASRMESLSALREMKPCDDSERRAIAIRMSEDETVIRSLYMIMRYSDTEEGIDMLYTFNAIRRYAEAYEIGITDAIRYIDDHDLKVKHIEEGILEQKGELFDDEDGTYDFGKLQDYIASMEEPVGVGLLCA